MDTSLLSGWLPWVVMALGAAGLMYLLWRTERWWWFAVVPGILITAGVAAWLIGDIGGESLFAEPLKTLDIVWIGVGLAGIGLAIGNMFGTAWPRKVLTVPAVIVVLLAAGNQVNKSYQQYPTVGDLFGPSEADQVGGLPIVTPGPDGSVTPSPTSPPLPPGPLTTTWTPTGSNIPADGKGKMSPITIPNTQSGFDARPGWVYLPPAYFADNAEPLPVIVLSAGQPGSPDNWLSGDRIQNVMNDFAAAHKGIAPVVVIPDTLGSDLANPICADTVFGKVDTYLAKDVPAAIRTQLRVDPNPQHWAFEGFSYGGTCAIQMATNHPDIYPNFVDISGQLEPTVGSRKQTVDAAFGGDAAKFTAINPMDLLAAKKYPDSAGWFVWGSDDGDARGEQLQVYGAAKAAGMDVQQWESPGTGHDWDTAAAGVAHTLPWLAGRMNLTA